MARFLLSLLSVILLVSALVSYASGAPTRGPTKELTAQKPKQHPKKSISSFVRALKNRDVKGAKGEKMAKAKRLFKDIRKSGAMAMSAGAGGLDRDDSEAPATRMMYMSKKKFVSAGAGGLGSEDA